VSEDEQHCRKAVTAWRTAAARTANAIIQTDAAVLHYITHDTDDSAGTPATPPWLVYCYHMADDSTTPFFCHFP
jgi:hypothetical protein